MSKATGNRAGYWVWALPRSPGDGVAAPQQRFTTRDEAKRWIADQSPLGRRLVVRRAK